MNRKYICIDIGGTAIKYGVTDEHAKVLERDTMPTKAWEGGSGILSRVMEIAGRYAQDAAGICISTAGIVDCDRGMIVHAGPTIPDYAGTDFKKELEQRFCLPCEVENDVNCAGLAEARGGAGKGADSVLCLTIGTGIGGCFVHEGQIYHGHTGSAMEVGYLSLDDSGKSFEQQGSASVMTHRVNELKGTDKGKEGYHWNGRHIFEAAREGDVDCISAIDEMVRVLGKGIASLCYVLNPEIIVLGGGIMAQEDYLLPRIRREMDSQLIPLIAEKTVLKAAHYRNEAGMVGAFYHFAARHPELIQDL